jgi:hypothetical protein
MYLLDTNVISELRRTRPHGAVVSWLQSVDDADLHLSAVTLGELQAGVEITREQDPIKAAEIEDWVDQVAQTWNILPLDGPTLRVWAKLMHRRSHDLLVDALIAAAATIHDLVVVTRNVRDFEPLHVQTLDPFSYENPAPQIPKT